MNKNVIKVPPPALPTFYVRLQGAPARGGWGVRHVSGADGVSPGAMLARWSIVRDEYIDFAFSVNDDPNPWLWSNEAEATTVVELLRTHADVLTEVVRV